MTDAPLWGSGTTGEMAMAQAALERVGIAQENLALAAIAAAGAIDRLNQVIAAGPHPSGFARVPGRETEVDWDEMGVDPHPEADKLDPGTWETGGRCICGAPLPAQKDWDGAGRDWASTVCGACGRGYVDEEEFIAIYDDGLGDDEATG